VHVIRQRNVHRIDGLALLLQHLAPVLIDAHFGEAALQRLHAAQIDVGDRDQLERRVARECIQIRQRLARRADAGVAERRRRGARVEREERTDRRSRGDRLEKAPAGQRFVGHAEQPTPIVGLRAIGPLEQRVPLRRRSPCGMRDGDGEFPGWRASPLYFVPNAYSAWVLRT
jgi:hypothetical protein